MFIVFYTVKTVFVYVFMTCSTSFYLCGTQKDPGNVCIYAWMFYVCMHVGKYRHVFCVGFCSSTLTFLCVHVTVVEDHVSCCCNCCYCCCCWWCYNITY